LFSLIFTTAGGTQTTLMYKDLISMKANILDALESFFELLDQHSREHASDLPLPPDVIKYRDDYSRQGAIRTEDLVTYIWNDIHKALEGNGEAQLIQARANAELNQKAMSDPKLRRPTRPGRSPLPTSI